MASLELSKLLALDSLDMSGNIVRKAQGVKTWGEQTNEF